MRVNIFSLQRIRRVGACSYTFDGVPQPGRGIPIYNQMGKQIATMEETKRARPTLICERLNGKEEEVLEAEVFGGKGVSMEFFHRRLGHTAQSGMERFVREQMVRGLEEGMKEEFGMCRGCQMLKSSEANNPRKNPKYRATERLELIHTGIVGPFKPKAIGGGNKQYNLVVIDEFSRNSWTIPLHRKSDVAEKLTEWILIEEKKSGKMVKKMRSDNGGE